MTGSASPAPYDTLREQLQDLRWRAGNPPYRHLGALWRTTPPGTGAPVTVFAAATISDNLNGRRCAMTWPFVQFFVASCLRHAQQVNIVLSPHDTRPGHWYALWLAQAPTHHQGATHHSPRPHAHPAHLIQGSIPLMSGAGWALPLTMGVTV